MAALTMKRATVAGLLTLAWLATTGELGNCNFFKPVQPERPRGSAIVGDYSSPTKTLETIARGIADKNSSNGQDVYTLSFADSLASCMDCRAYHGFFDLADLNRVNTWDRNADWNRAREQAFYVSFIQLRTVPYLMRWEPYEPGGNETGSDRDSLLHRKYKVYQLTAGVDSVIAIGVADLYFVKSTGAGNRWVIARWQDFVFPQANRDQFPDRETMGYRRLFSTR